jgi:hypothetical protein
VTAHSHIEESEKSRHMTDDISKRLTDDELKLLKDAEAKATPGNWYSHHCKSGKDTECWCKVVGTSPDPSHDYMDAVISAGSTKREDAEFITLARNLMPKLIQEVAALRASSSTQFLLSQNLELREQRAGLTEELEKLRAENAQLQADRVRLIQLYQRRESALMLIDGKRPITIEEAREIARLGMSNEALERK